MSCRLLLQVAVLLVALHAGKGYELRAGGKENRENGSTFRPRGKFQKQGISRSIALACTSCLPGPVFRKRASVMEWLVQAQWLGLQEELEHERVLVKPGVCHSLPRFAPIACCVHVPGRPLSAVTSRKAAGITSGSVIPMRGACKMLWHNRYMPSLR